MNIPQEIKDKIVVEAMLFADDQVFDRNKWKQVLAATGTTMGVYGYQLAQEEIERLRALIPRAWDQSRINCEVENGAGDAGESFVPYKQFATENNLK